MFFLINVCGGVGDGGWEVNQGPPGPEPAAKESWSPIATVQNGRNKARNELYLAGSLQQVDDGGMTTTKTLGKKKKQEYFFTFVFLVCQKKHELFS